MPSDPSMKISSASELLARMIQGEVSAADVATEHLERIKRYNRNVNAVVTLDEAGAMRAALHADQRVATRGPLGPLHGVPFTVKDAFETAGMRTTSSHKPLASHIPARDATLVSRLKAAGGILLGKTNLPELAGNPQCDSPLFGRTNNPWDLSRTSGGSSGGSAAAVAMGFAMLDPGSDIGGSIRIPAAFCGVAGLKATENRLPRTGHIPHLPGRPRSVRHLLSFGLLARSVADLQLGFEIMAGPDGQDVEVPAIPTRTLSAQQRPRRIAWWDDFDGVPLCSRTRRALARSVDALQAAGHIVARCRPDGFDFGQAWHAYGTIAGSEIGLGMSWPERTGLTLAGHLIPASQPVGRAFLRGMSASPGSYNQALNLREQLIVTLEAFLDEWDAWLCPVAPTVAYPHCKLGGLKPPPRIQVDDHALPYIEATVSMVVPFSLTGSPVTVLPAGIEDGLPVGLQLVGRRWHDEELLATCAQIESCFDGYTLPPLADETPDRGS